MADLVVTDVLTELVGQLDYLVGEFKGALDLEDRSDDIWGQRNANLSMGDFADNWTSNRDELVADMEKLRDTVRSVAESWGSVDAELTSSLSRDRPDL
ncbi:hypothetical protein [Cellulomonas xiejunii]|uniref:WXG100 family type VII secretion target n=1 Tax=Cellulomonas xiejunii TaxID=2968083 RepID=A0ABY5KMT0_9CELL|nr:hypothetical protein [Cellulomonas xiejunii]MCC2323476.1 hypothetical protein [Cellulomonas xiejunii]UUI71594.1 hypothetical protein NP048_17670 [Cellulomonas xiejunii]